MKRFIGLLISLLIINNLFSQVRIDVWNKLPNVGKTIANKTNSLPKSFESKMPDGSQEVYEKFDVSPIKVTTSSGKLIRYTPICYKTKSSSSILTYSNKNGWNGFFKPSFGNSYSIFSNRVNQDTSVYKSENFCKEIVDINNKTQNSKTVPKIGLTNWTNTEYYNRLDPIKKICTLYIEVSNDVFQGLGSDQDQVLSYVNNYFLGIDNIFRREGICLQLNKIHLNDQIDGWNIFDGQTSLVTFQNRINQNLPVNSESHFKMLLDLNSTVYGVGFLGSYGSPNGYVNSNPTLNSLNCITYVNLSNEIGNFNQTPINSYSHPIFVACHELGHNFGSRHTHWCGWKNDTGAEIGMIDSCQFSEGNPCLDLTNYRKFSTLPSIMSYCPNITLNRTPPSTLPYWEYISGTLHLNVGGLFTRGFDKYPRHSIRSSLYLSNEISEVIYNTPPTVTTYESVTSVGINTAQSGGVVQNIGDGPFLVRGLVWSTTDNPSIYNNSGYEIAVYGSVGSFNITMTNLLANTTYYVRSFATNLSGVAYGDVRTFNTSTPTIPSVLTSYQSKTNTTITVGGTNINTGGGQIQEKGVIWSTSQNNLDYNLTTKLIDQSSGSTSSSNYLLTIPNLNSSTTYWVRSFVKTEAGIGYGSAISVETVTSDNIVFTNILTNEVLSTKAKFMVSLISDGGSNITSRGFCWSTSPNPTINDNQLTVGSGLGTYQSIIRNLNQETTYYLRGFSQNSQGVTYSPEDIVFTTKKLVFYLTNITTNPTNFTSTTFIDTDEVPNNNGIVISTTTPDVTLSNASGYAYSGVSFPSPYTGSRSLNLSYGGIPSGQLVYVRPFIIDKLGETNYGSSMTFVVPDRPVVTSNIPNITTPNSITMSGTVVSDGGSQIIERGIMYKLSTFPSYDDPSTTKVTTSGQLGTFTISIQNLIPGQIYFFASFAKNQSGSVGFSTNYIVQMPLQLPILYTNPTVQNLSNNYAMVSGQVLNRWGKNVTSMGIIFSTDVGFIISSYKFVSPPTDDVFNIPLTGLQPLTTYYFKTFATTSDGTGYGEVRSFTTTSQSVPSLSTSSISNLLYNSATSGGTIQSNGFSNITQTGVCWSTSPNPTINLTTKTTDGPNTSTFISNISGLSPLQTYFIRSYATNSVGTGYGNELSFTTPPSPFPVVLTSNSVATTSTTASSGGEITNQGDAPVTQRGVIWSTTFDNLTIVLPTKTSNGIGVGQFTSNIIGLNPNTTYYIKAYAKNNFGVGYGNLVGITTPQSGDKQCAISEMSVSQGPTAGGLRWFSQFNLNINCQSYKVDVSRYTSDPTNNPNLTPVQTYVINNANPYTPSITDLNNGYVRLLMKPQPFGDPVNGTWYSLNVKCNGTCSSNPITKQYFYIPPP